MSDVIVTPVPGIATIIVTEQSPSAVVITSIEQGPPGPVGDALGAFLVSKQFSELDTMQAKIAARQNLELQQIDCGVFL